MRAFILALSVVSIVSWRLNENARRDAERAHAQTRSSEAEFRSAFDDAPIGMAIVDLAGRFERINRSLCELTDYTPRTLLTMRLDDLVGAPRGRPGRRRQHAPSARSAVPTVPVAGGSSSNRSCATSREPSGRS